jgi:hypothetical protein
MGPSSPALGSDGRVYIGSSDKNIYSLNSTGVLAWSYSAASLIGYSPTLASDGRLYIGADFGDNNIYCLNSASVLAWSYRAAAYMSSSPALGSDGRVYVAFFDTNIYCLNSAGVLAWSYSPASYVDSSPAIGSDGRIYVGSRDTNIYCLDSVGGLAWSYSTAAYWVDSSPALGSDGRLYVGSGNGDNNIYCLEQAPTPTITPTLTDTPTITPTSPASTPTDTPVSPTDTPSAPTSTPKPTPVLSVEPSELRAGWSFTLEIQLHEDINDAFDFYLLVDTQFGPYTFYLDRRRSVKPGIAPAFRNIQGFQAPFQLKFTPSVILPMIMGEKQVTFYAVAVNAGRMPPVSGLSQLTSTTRYVILLDKQVRTVNR